MKKSIITTFCTITLSAALFTSCGSKAKGNLNLPPLEIQTIKSSTELYDIEVDPRIEVMGIICRLAGFEQFNNPNFANDSYIMTIDTMFCKYNKEPAVKTAAKIKKQNVDPKLLTDLAYFIKPDFSGINYDLNNPTEDFKILTKKYNAAELETFVKQINDFAHKVGFARFYDLNRTNYKTWVALMVSTLDGNKDDKIKVEQWVKDFYKGYGFERITICPTYVTQSWRYFYEGSEQQGKVQPHFILAPYENGMQVVIMTSVLKAFYLLNNHWNEIEAPVKELYRKFKVKNNITYDIREKYQLSWLLCDAFDSDYVFIQWGENEKEALEDACIKAYRFEEFPEIVKIVDDYVSNPDKYSDLDRLLPEFIKLIESL